MKLDNWKCKILKNRENLNKSKGKKNFKINKNKLQNKKNLKIWKNKKKQKKCNKNILKKSNKE